MPLGQRKLGHYYSCEFAAGVFGFVGKVLTLSRLLCLNESEKEMNTRRDREKSGPTTNRVTGVVEVWRRDDTDEVVSYTDSSGPLTGRAKSRLSLGMCIVSPGSYYARRKPRLERLAKSRRRLCKTIRLRREVMHMIRKRKPNEEI